MDLNIYSSEYLYSKSFNTPAIFKIKDPGSSITHFIGFLTAIVATPTILVYGASRGINLAGLKP